MTLTPPSGDNFYSDGVTSVNSTRFNDTFEQVYTREQFGDLPFYVIAGNHDWRSSVDAQIAYSGVDPRWNFPSYFYGHNFSWTTSDGQETRTAELLLLDTVLLCGQSDVRDPATGEWQTLKGSELRGPNSAEHRALADDQWQWLTERLASSEVSSSPQQWKQSFCSSPSTAIYLLSLTLQHPFCYISNKYQGGLPLGGGPLPHLERRRRRDHPTAGRRAAPAAVGERCALLLGP